MNWGHWVNLTDYTPLSLITFGIGCLGWLVVYAIVIRKMIKEQVLEIPIEAVCSNFAWEICWGLIYKTDMGLLFQWAYKFWFFFDVVVVFFAIKYGRKQMTNALTQKYYLPLIIGQLVAWVMFFYYFIPEHDDKFGALTGYMISVYMGFLYIIQKLKQPDSFGNSKIVAWVKFLSTAGCTFACFQRYPDHKSLMICILWWFITDFVYALMVTNEKGLIVNNEQK